VAPFKQILVDSHFHSVIHCQYVSFKIFGTSVSKSLEKELIFGTVTRMSPWENVRDIE
jgi:hypothetical protein